MPRYSPFFIQTKKVILQIHGFKCFLCGKVSFSTNLHHNDHNNRNDNFNNLVPLCSVCHKNVHSARIAVNFIMTPEVQKQLKIFYKLYLLV